MTEPLVLVQHEDPLAGARQKAEEKKAIGLRWYGLTENFVITTDEEQAGVVEVIRDAKRHIAEIEEQRKAFVNPLNQVVRGLNAFFKEPREIFEKLEESLKGKLEAYVASKNAANEAALQAAAAAPTAQVAQETLAVLAPVAPPSGVSIRYIWKFEVTDPDLVPREYCSPDPSKLKQADPGTPIPGVRFFQEASTTVRQR